MQVLGWTFPTFICELEIFRIFLYSAIFKEIQEYMGMISSPKEILGRQEGCFQRIELCVRI
jgi:hypothetical protein